jgi:YfiH family protein
MSQSETKFLSIKPVQLGSFSELIVAQSTRHGGVSPAPFSSLNLGGSTRDTPENVGENHRIFWESLGVPAESVAKSHQVHGTEVLQVIEPGRFAGYDALVTDQKNIILAVTIADCTPILIYDPNRKVVAAIHAGWRGTVAGIVSKTVAVMQDHYGSLPADCNAFIGVCIDECSFEVGQEVADEFASEFKRFDETINKYFVDLKLANKAQLTGAGILEENIEVSPLSTVSNNADFFSYRLEKGQTGRMLAVIGMRS